MKLLMGWLGRGASLLLFHSPEFVRHGLGNLLAFLWFDLFRIRRKVMLANISIAFPELPEKEKVRIARQSLRHLGWNLVEYSYLPLLTPKNVDDIFEFRGLDVLDAALRPGKGVLLLTLHMGHGDLAAAALAIKGYPMVLVSKIFKLKWLNDLWFGMREKAGVKFIPPRNSSYGILKALKKNAVIIFVNDQFTGPPIGVKTTFFGKETGTALGLSVMSERSGAPVVSVFCYRNEDRGHVIHFVREMPREGPAERVTQNYNDELESFVRKHPEQWMWLHQRWKRFVVQ